VPASALASSVGGLSAVYGNITPGDLSGSGILTPSAADFLAEQQGMIYGRPKAYVNWLLLDERFNYVAGSSGAQQVGTNEEFKLHEFTNLPISKSGYLYVFVNNETTNVPVYFDNLQVTHIRGPLPEETHYYPFGLTMAGINSKAVQFGNPENKYTYNSKEEQRKEFSDLSGLEWLDYGARMYDAQIGRWHVQDAKSDKYNWSTPYSYVLSNPLVYIDPDGNDIIIAFTGGPTGGGKSINPNSKDAGTTGRVIREAQKFAKENGIDFKETVITPGWTSGSSVENAKNFISDNYTQGEKIIIYGYSYGGDFAVELAKELKDMSIQVDLVITVDASDGPANNMTVDDVIPTNVKEAQNYYQTDKSGASSGSQKSGSNGSQGGSSNSPGSHGDPKRAKDPAKTKVTNHNMSNGGKGGGTSSSRNSGGGTGVNHGNIDEKVFDDVMKNIKKVMSLTKPK
jgi:RHS repeat-associated protein